jgi:ribosomal protein S18 acetylase RimI-like enzyme
MINEARIRQLLTVDPVWCAYALADLQPAFAPYCRWQIGTGRDGAGLVLLFGGLIPCVLFSTGAAEGVAAALAQAELPDHVYITIPEAHLPVVARHYDFGGSTRPMARLVLTGAPAARDGAPPVVRLGPEDGARIQALFRHGGPFTPDGFDPYQLADGVFYGVTDGTNGLAAVGGTHIVDWESSIAAVGNMYTRPDCRGRGFATAILQAIVGALRARAVQMIVLNVDRRNTAAQRLYMHHGFTRHCTYLEGIGHRESR